MTVYCQIFWVKCQTRTSWTPFQFKEKIQDFDSTCLTRKKSISYYEMWTHHLSIGGNIQNAAGQNTTTVTSPSNPRSLVRPTPSLPPAPGASASCCAGSGPAARRTPAGTPAGTPRTAAWGPPPAAVAPSAARAGAAPSPAVGTAPRPVVWVRIPDQVEFRGGD